MDKIIELLLCQHISSVDINDTIEIVEKTLGSRKSDCVIVTTAEGSCFGIITNTDIALFHKEHKNNKVVKAWEICAHQLISVDSEASIKEISELMIKNKVHHIVILKDEIAIGYISSRDVLEYDFIQSQQNQQYNRSK